jgi:hypothetical protein
MTLAAIAAAEPSTGIWMIQLLHLQQISYGETLK